jgi:Uncharacterised protein family (UPF0236)
VTYIARIEIESLVVKLLGEGDLESEEIYMRERMLELGRKTLEKVLTEIEAETTGKFAEGQNYKLYGYRSRKLLTLLGKIDIKRKYYYNQQEHKSRIPFDERLGILESSYSCGIQKVVSRVGAYMPFDISGRQIKELTGILIDGKTVERITKQIGKEVHQYNQGGDKRMPDRAEISKQTMYLCMDGTGIPMSKKELRGRKGKQTAEAKTREVKLGCIFTQIGVTSDGYPVREAESTTYVGGIINAESFGREVYNESTNRKSEQARRLCIIGDGAAWIWNIAEEYFPGAIQIVDLYHAREHYWNVARSFYNEGSKMLNLWTENRRKELEAGNARKVIKAIKRLKSRTCSQRSVVETEIAYFNKHKNRMRYNYFRKNKLFVGSGVLEAGCKSVIGQRLKQSGMHWSLGGANSVIALRCCMHSNQWEDFWEKRAA